MDSAPTSAQERLRGLPLFEAHAHLNGSIPPAAIAELVCRKSGEAGNEDLASFALPSDLASFDIHSFFPLFGSFIYRLTADAPSVTFATLAVLTYFEEQGCVYLELRTTPRPIPTLASYLAAVRAGFAAFRPQKGMLAKLLLSVDRRHSVAMAEAVVDLALANRDFVVGVDLCGDPTKGDVALFVPAFDIAREGGLKVTVHLGELESQLVSQEADFGLRPDRLGHATFLSKATASQVVQRRIPIEICLTSNLVCKTVASLADHHLSWALENSIPILICTDDALIFHTSLAEEYALALSLCRPRTLRTLLRILEGSIPALFCTDEEKEGLRARLGAWADGQQGLDELVEL